MPTNRDTFPIRKSENTVSTISRFRTQIPPSTWDSELDRRMHLSTLGSKLKPLPLMHQDLFPTQKKAVEPVGESFWIDSVFLGIAVASITLLSVASLLALRTRYGI